MSNDRLVRATMLMAVLASLGGCAAGTEPAAATGALFSNVAVQTSNAQSFQLALAAPQNRAEDVVWVQGGATPMVELFGHRTRLEQVAGTQYRIADLSSLDRVREELAARLAGEYAVGGTELDALHGVQLARDTEPRIEVTVNEAGEVESAMLAFEAEIVPESATVRGMLSDLDGAAADHFRATVVLSTHGQLVPLANYDRCERGEAGCRATMAGCVCDPPPGSGGGGC